MSVNFQTSACNARASFGLNSGKRLSEGLTNHQPVALLQRGFTLIELLIVVSLLALIATIAVGVSNVDAGTDFSRIEMAEIRKSLLQFKRDMGSFPAAGDLELLWVCEACDDYNLDTKRGWNGPYILASRTVTDEEGTKERGLFDSWGKPYLLLDSESAVPGAGTARIVSTGPDESNNGLNDEDPCLPAEDSDDIVLCLVQ